MIIYDDITEIGPYDVPRYMGETCYDEYQAEVDDYELEEGQSDE